MRRLAAALAIVMLLTRSSAVVAAGEVKVDGRTFRVPDGFDVEKIAGPPLVDRPIVADFDDRGRLLVADSSGSNEPVQAQLATRPHRIVRLEDGDGDGRFDRRTIFADRMMFPEGALWHAGSLYVAAPPSIWKLTDRDGDGVAESREEWFQGKTLTGCANDLHGPYLGPDGWIYWCKGAFAEQTYERHGRPPLVTRAAHIFRRRPDGGEIEAVMTGGMDNPVDVVFTPGGERIFTTTFLQIPGGGRRDGLIHAVYGGVYGKVHDVIDGHPRTSPDVMPVLTHLGAAAPCGLALARSDAFGTGYRGSLYATLFNMHKVTRHELVPDGATFRTVDHDFLVAADDRDFHPTDVQEDADGSLVVLDTGGWYKICCPTSQLKKPDVLGAIYRVRRTGSKRPSDPRGEALALATMPAADLTRHLDDPGSSVRSRAAGELVARGGDAVPALAEVLTASGSATARREAAWALCRIDHPSARRAGDPGISDRDESVRQAALHAVAVRRDRGALPRLLEVVAGRAGLGSGVVSATAGNRRVAAEALGRIGDVAAVPALLEAAGGPADRVLEHSLIYALIEIADPAATRIGLASTRPGTHRAALVALDQMGGRALEAEAVAPLLSSEDPALREAAIWIVGRHPEWGGGLAARFRERLAAEAPGSPGRADLEDQLARFSSSKPIQDLLGGRLADPTTTAADRLGLLRAMGRSGLKQAPGSWAPGLTAALSGGDDATVRQAVATAKGVPFGGDDARLIAPALIALAKGTRFPAAVRLDALLALPAGVAAIDAGLFRFLLEAIGTDRPLSERLAAADVLARATLDRTRLLELAGRMGGVGPLERDRLLPAFEKASDEAVGLRLIEALETSPALAGLRPDALKPRLAKFGATVRRRAEALYTRLDAEAASQRKKLEGLMATLPSGDVRRGQAVFNGSKAACSTCHAIGYLGGRVGPDLTTIGQVRTEGDLLESILIPSASFVRSFEPVTVATKEGKVYNGILRKDAADEVILATGADQEARIARGEIDEMRPGTVSVMPAGLDQQLSRAELADLLAFLKATRWR